MKTEPYCVDKVLEGENERFQDVAVSWLQLGTSGVSAGACTRAATTTTKLQGGEVELLRRESELTQESSDVSCARADEVLGASMNRAEGRCVGKGREGATAAVARWGGRRGGEY